MISNFQFKKKVRKCPLKLKFEKFESYDPYQVFKVAHESNCILRISNLCGVNITKGRLGDLMDVPDPYLIFQVTNTPNGKMKTRHVDNNTNPVWEDVFEFYVGPKEENMLEVKLMDANYTIDETMGIFEFKLTELLLGVETKITFHFPNSSMVNAVLLLKTDERSDLRYSLALCDDEKLFLQRRWRKVYQRLQTLLQPGQAPQALREVPVIGMLGSGGGFRAMVCFSGVFKALAASGILDCVTYVAGLSGSAWYLSTLYSHPNFPEQSPGELQSDLKRDINKSPFSLLTLQGLYQYLRALSAKHASGQHVSFTDFFGHLLGDTLLKERKDYKLTDQQVKLTEGLIPMPLYTCLHVKKNVTAKVFQEWIEFTPYEIGIAKYGTFMKTSIFGSKLYLGRIVKRYPEFPMHYLQGVWGSAFCILFRQLVQENGRKDLAQIMRENESKQNEAELDQQLENFALEDNVSESENEDFPDDCDQQKRKSKNEKRLSDTPMEAKLKPILEKREQSQASMWERVMKTILTTPWLNTCEGRAGMIHNPLRGLSLKQLYPLSPLSPTTPTDDIDFKGIHEALPTDAKKLYLVDGGLTFNSPYPLLLRPQRGINLYLSFDFSARASDQTPPFKELLLAEKWAKANNLLFPPIENLARTFAKEPVKECYVFRHPESSDCPIILHFVIINDKFRQYKAPGVLRETADEKEFANFDIFDDPENQYSLYNFNYSSLQFNRLSQLMEFNTLENLETIKETIAEVIQRKRNSLPKPPISLGDIAKLKLKFRSKDALKQLKAYVRSFSRGNVNINSKNSSETPISKLNVEESSDSEYETPEED